ncbi:MAG: S-methyl-5-thioribose-1-phosphate isomerase [Rhodospirillaceae bacterium]|nr:S-methyl-5-thioribose-1-phosphate isomerase [Rhodospirillaceae bacterium]
MRVDGKSYRSIWRDGKGTVTVIDQTFLPFSFVTRPLRTVDEAAEAIAIMRVRGAPLIGATAAYGICLAMDADPSDEAFDAACQKLLTTRPTAINLRWALDDMRRCLWNRPRSERAAAAYERADAICEEDVSTNEAIGRHALGLFMRHWEEKGETDRLNVLTHCNAGWLATVDWGTALSPVFQAHQTGIPVHVWVDETRPRNQGASLTAWELVSHGIPYTVIVDNAGGHLMQRGAVDLCIVGTDRTTAGGDVCNKIGTYLKALAARDNGIPFYVALPGSTIDWTLENGRDIPIEERDPSEVTTLRGVGDDGITRTFHITPEGSPSENPAFDVTPRHLVTAFVTERGVCPASREGLTLLYPERRSGLA